MKFGLELHRQELDLLPANLKVVLSAACAQRHSCVYNAYVTRTQAGNAKLFNRSLKLIWQETLSDPLSDDELKKMQDRVTGLIPSRGKAPKDAYEANAEYAVLALAYCIRTTLGGDTSDLMRTASKAVNSIDHFLMNPIGGTPQLDSDHPQWKEQLSGHALVQAEHLRQERDLSDVQHADVDSMPDIITRIRERAEIDSKSFLPAEVMGTNR